MGERFLRLYACQTQAVLHSAPSRDHQSLPTDVRLPHLRLPRREGSQRDGRVRPYEALVDHFGNIVTDRQVLCSRSTGDVVGVLHASPFDGIAEPVLRALSGNGEATERILLRDLPDAALTVQRLVVPGPMYPLARVVDHVLARPDEWPPLYVWLTEQTPDPAAEPLRLAAQLHLIRLSGTMERALAARLAWSSRMQRMLAACRMRGRRLRFCDEIRRIYDTGNLGGLAVMTPTHADFYAGRVGVPARCVPYGLDASHGHDMHLERDIDVVFLGSVRDRRRRLLLQRLLPQISAQGLTVEVIDGSTGMLFGEDRTRLLNRCKIMLNILRQPWDDILYRMLLASANGVLLVSEPVADPYPFEPFLHFVAGDPSDLARLIERFVRSEALRSAIVGRAGELLSGSYSIGDMSRKLLV